MCVALHICKKEDKEESERFAQNVPTYRGSSNSCLGLVRWLSQWVKVLVAKSNDWSLVPGTHIVEENNDHKILRDYHIIGEASRHRRSVVHMAHTLCYGDGLKMLKVCVRPFANRLSCH